MLSEKRRKRCIYLLFYIFFSFEQFFKNNIYLERWFKYRCWPIFSSFWLNCPTLHKRRTVSCKKYNCNVVSSSILSSSSSTSSSCNRFCICVDISRMHVTPFTFQKPSTTCGTYDGAPIKIKIKKYQEKTRSRKKEHVPRKD